MDNFYTGKFLVISYRKGLLLFTFICVIGTSYLVGIELIFVVFACSFWPTLCCNIGYQLSWLFWDVHCFQLAVTVYEKV
jgi:hypothetical protein